MREKGGEVVREDMICSDVGVVVVMFLYVEEGYSGLFSRCVYLV